MMKKAGCLCAAMGAVLVVSLGAAADDRPGVKSGWVDVDNAKLYYEERGQGMPVILIHGGGLNLRNWDDQFEALSEGCRVIRYDARMHGRSEVEPGKFSHHEDLNRLMETLGIPKAVVMGLSMGGYIAIDFALAHPDKVIALIPVAPGLTGYDFKDKEIIENNAKLNQAKTIDEAVEYVMRSWTDGPRRLPSEVDPAFRERARLMYKETFQNGKPGGPEERLAPPASGRLAEIRVPTLVLAGGLDMPGVLEICDLIAAQVPGARKEIIPGAAHLVNMEKPAEFNALVRAFLESIDAPGTSRAEAVPGWRAVNRSVTEFEEDGRKGIRLDERQGDGEVWLEDTRFADGTIEFDVRGKDAFQRSFVGTAFHGADDETFEAVYFRPFNFKPADPARASRAVQYVSHPGFTWQKLRAEKPGQYEKAVAPVPDPNGWFHVRIVVASPKISIYVDGAPEPCLVVETLSGRREGSVGLMVGNGSGGDFANFRVTPAAPAPSRSGDLLEAVKAGDLAGVKTMVEGDPGIVNAAGPGGQTILFAAISFNKPEIVEYLVGKGADVNVATLFQSPLVLACARKVPLQIIRLLVEKGADVNTATKFSGRPMDVALDDAAPAVIDYLKSKGAAPTPLDFEIGKITERVYKIAYPWGMRNNIVVFSASDGILLVDTGFSRNAVGALRKTIAGLAPGEIKFVVNTHPHGDHVKGNSIAPVAAKLVHFAALEGPELKGLFVKRDRPFEGRGGREFAAPYTLRFNGEDVLIIPNPGLHSDADILVYFPKSNVLCMGDLLLSQCCPALDDVAGYMAFLVKVIAAFPEETVFVSGHGKDLNMAGLKKYRDDLVGMIAIVRTNLAAGKTAEDMLRGDVLKDYKAEYSFLDWIGPDFWLRRIVKALESGVLK